MRRQASRLVAALAVSLSSFLLLAWIGCSTAAPSNAAVPVRVAMVQEIAIGNTVRYSANIIPTSQVDLSFKSGGYVNRIRMVRGADGNMRKVDEGDWVQKGTVLAVVDERDYLDKLHQADAQLGRAKADLEHAKLQFERTSILYASHSATKPDYDRDKAEYDSAQAAVMSSQAQVSEAKTALAYCSLQAPFDAWIVKRNVDLGALVGPATNGFTLANTHLVKAVFGVPDTAIHRVKLGQVHAITTDASTESFEGKVTAISPAADPKSRVYSVEVTIPNPRGRLKSGMIATITVVGQQMPSPIMGVPLESVVRDPQRPSGFAVIIAPGSGDSAVAEVRSVKLGDAYGDVVAVTNGIRLGERVVTRGSTLLKGGDEVRVIP